MSDHSKIEALIKSDLAHIKEKLSDIVEQFKILNGSVKKNKEWIDRNKKTVEEFDDIAKLARQNDKKLYGLFAVFTVINILVGIAVNFI